MGVTGVKVSDKKDKFVFSINDDIGETIGEQEFNILVIFDKPSLLHKDYPLAMVSNNTLLVNKGEFAYVDREHLNIVDFRNTGCKFLYQLKAEPKFGKVKRDKSELAINGTFSQKDINKGLVTFHQNGNGDGWDFFVFAVLNEKGEAIASNALPVKIVIDNSAPVFLNLNDVALHKGNTVEVTNDYLLASDQEQGPDQLTYEIVEMPKFGELTCEGSGVLKGGARFTQQDIDKGKISYRHTSKTIGNDSLTFTVSDGEGGVTERKTINVVSLQIGEALPAIGHSIVEGDSEEKSNQEKKVMDKGSIYVNTLTSQSLVPADVYVFNDPAFDHMEFLITLKDAPSHGQITKTRTPPKTSMDFRKGLPLKEGESFSKEDLVHGLIAYQHNDKEAKEDQFTLKVFDKRKKLTYFCAFKAMMIEDNKAPVLVERHELIVVKDGTRSITNKLLKAVDAEQGPEELTFTVLTRPERGSLVLYGKALQNGGTFTQYDVNKGGLSYAHNGSKESEDSFMVNVSDGAGGSLDKIRMHIFITKNQIALFHNHPLSVSSSGESIFNKNNLEVIYTGTEKPGFTYSLDVAPEKGEMLLKGEVLQPGMNFTQEDIENGDLAYHHTG
ncbi:MAG: hypothetical protein ACI9S8_002646 [Chlamydiales bacterium]|jgi:hypothetical protein